MEFLSWVEQLTFSTWVRESGEVYGYALILTLHTLGLALLMGISFAFNLRLLGYGGESPFAPYERYFPYLWLGFWINAISGVMLLMADATTKMINPVFYVKMTLIALAVWNVSVVHKRLRGSALPDNARLLAWTSILLWIGATTAGRLMAYIGPVAGL
jgi:hypothetical protein